MHQRALYQLCRFTGIEKAAKAFGSSLREGAQLCVERIAHGILLRRKRQARIRMHHQLAAVFVGTYLQHQLVSTG